MNARIIVPLIPDMLAQLLESAPALMNIRDNVLAADPRLVIATYRAAVATGTMETVAMMN